MASPLSSPSGARVELHGVQGHAPGGIPAYSNRDDNFFTQEDHRYDHIFVGYKWQCVEFARRWLLLRKGLLIPGVDFAAHIFHLKSVIDPATGKEVPVHTSHNKGKEAPVADSLIIYASSPDNFVGHIGVIVEAGEGFIRVADQNRFFHHWGDAHYSQEFPVVRHSDGTYEIIDAHATPLGWLSFPTHANLPEGSPSVRIPLAMKDLPQVPLSTRIPHWLKSIWGLPFRHKMIFVYRFTSIAPRFFGRMLLGSLLEAVGLRKKPAVADGPQVASPTSARNNKDATKKDD